MGSLEKCVFGPEDHRAIGRAGWGIFGPEDQSTIGFGGILDGRTVGTGTLRLGDVLSRGGVSAARGCSGIVVSAAGGCSVKVVSAAGSRSSMVGYLRQKAGVRMMRTEKSSRRPMSIMAPSIHLEMSGSTAKFEP